MIKLWDTETGQVKNKFTNKKVPYCVVFNREEGKDHLFLAGTSDKKILCVSLAPTFRLSFDLLIAFSLKLSNIIVRHEKR